jgi:hypothetical protein
MHLSADYTQFEACQARTRSRSPVAPGPGRRGGAWSLSGVAATTSMSEPSWRACRCQPEMGHRLGKTLGAPRSSWATVPPTCPASRDGGGCPRSLPVNQSTGSHQRFLLGQQLISVEQVAQQGAPGHERCVSCPPGVEAALDHLVCRRQCRGAGRGGRVSLQAARGPASSRVFGEDRTWWSVNNVGDATTTV